MKDNLSNVVKRHYSQKRTTYGKMNPSVMKECKLNPPGDTVY